MDTSTGADTMRIFLIGLSDAFARSVVRYLGSDSRIELCGVAPDLVLGSMLLPATHAALALVDWSALGAVPGSGLRSLRAGCPGLWIACVVDQADAYREQAFGAGANAVISQERFSDEIEPLLMHIFGMGNPLRGRPCA
jgi:DNA-binding NarL/FixJ family response regulator